MDPEFGRNLSSFFFLAANSCLGVKVKRAPETGSYKGPSARREEKENRQMPGRSGSGRVRLKMGLIPPSNPAAFPLFEVTSGLDFPPARPAGRKSSGWVEGGAGPLLPQPPLPSRVNREDKNTQIKQKKHNSDLRLNSSPRSDEMAAASAPSLLLKTFNANKVPVTEGSGASSAVES